MQAPVLCDIMAHTGSFGLNIPAQVLNHLNQLKHTQWPPHLISALNLKYFSAGIKEEASHIWFIAPKISFQVTLEMRQM